MANIYDDGLVSDTSIHGLLNIRLNMCPRRSWKKYGLPF